MKKKFASIYLQDDGQYTYYVKNPPKRFLTIDDRNVGNEIMVAMPKTDVHVALKMKRRQRAIMSIIGVLITLLVLGIIAIIIMYSMSEKFMTRNFKEEQFSLVYSHSSEILSSTKQDDIIKIIKEDGDLSQYNYATIVFEGTPSLIGYKIDIKTPENIFVYSGRIFGLEPGEAIFDVYSQDGTFLTTRTVVVGD